MEKESFMKPHVTIAACENYLRDTVSAALEEVINPIAGLDWVKPGMNIVVKPNLVMFKKPDAAATTHPAVVAGVCRMLIKRGARVVVGDSPGGTYNAPLVNAVYAATGMALAEREGAELNRDFGQATACNPSAYRAKEIRYTSYLDKADAIIDVCKLKTHGMMGLSGAVKNMFGTVPGTVKPEYHYRYPDTLDFAHALVDIEEYFKPRLVIVDAVVGMEGNGPTAGTPRSLGALIASTNAHWADLVCAELIGLEPDRIPTIVAAQQRGLAPQSVHALAIHGSLQAFSKPDFLKLPTRSVGQLAGKSPLVKKALTACLASYPDVMEESCVGCGECLRMCPANAIIIKDKKPRIRRSVCIRCFCCQEFCPCGAMKSHRTLVARFLGK